MFEDVAQDQPIAEFTHSWQVHDRLYRKKIKEIDKRIKSVQDMLKSKASDIYYEKKVELENLVKEKKNLEEKKLENMLKKTKATNESKATIRELRKIMESYDIKHPLRGEK